MARHETLAAVDLGSNSFHLEIGRVVERQIYPLDAVREVVRLGGGLTADKRIDRATQASALEALGFPIEVISGREEARLIYLGVAHALPVSAQRRLVIDVGGGSSEFIIGTGFEPQLTESLYMGCVSFSLKYFPEGRIDKAGMRAAELAARQELAGIVRAYRAAGWDEAVASSGTARSIENILRANEFARDGLTREGLERLRSLLLKQGAADPA